MPEPTQTFANHARYLPGFHFFVLPVLWGNVIVAAVSAARAPSMVSAWAVAMALALGLLALYARAMPLGVQDRLIRLEESMRLRRLMPGRDADIDRLSRDHLVALRFACDAEAPGLVDRVLAGEVRTRKEIKGAVKVWRPDHHRA